jgi:hypothetical protein
MLPGGSERDAPLCRVSARLIVLPGTDSLPNGFLGLQDGVTLEDGFDGLGFGRAHFAEEVQV